MYAGFQGFNMNLCVLSRGGMAYSQNHPLEYTLVCRAFCVYVCRISRLHDEHVRFVKTGLRVRRIIPYSKPQYGEHVVRMYAGFQRSRMKVCVLLRQDCGFAESSFRVDLSMDVMWCETWDERCEMWDVRREMWDVRCEMRDVRYEMWHVRWEMWDVRCDVMCDVWFVMCDLWCLMRKWSGGEEVRWGWDAE